MLNPSILENLPTRAQLEVMQDTARFMAMLAAQLEIRSQAERDPETKREMNSDARRARELHAIYCEERREAVQVVNDMRTVAAQGMEALQEMDRRMLSILGKQ
jgi:hypothetical protein